jgi:hypothetical protein
MRKQFLNLMFFVLLVSHLKAQSGLCNCSKSSPDKNEKLIALIIEGNKMAHSVYQKEFSLGNTQMDPDLKQCMEIWIFEYWKKFDKFQEKVSKKKYDQTFWNGKKQNCLNQIVKVIEGNPKYKEFATSSRKEKKQEKRYERRNEKRLENNEELKKEIIDRNKLEIKNKELQDTLNKIKTPSVPNNVDFVSQPDKINLTSIIKDLQAEKLNLISLIKELQSQKTNLTVLNNELQIEKSKLKKLTDNELLNEKTKPIVNKKGTNDEQEVIVDITEISLNNSNLELLDENIKNLIDKIIETINKKKVPVIKIRSIKLCE